MYIKKLFSLSWPVMLGMILQTLLTSVDLFYISKLGKDYAAAASLSNSSSTVIFVLSSLVSAGAIALVSRSYGSSDEESVRTFSGISIILAVIIGAFSGILCFIFTKSILSVMFDPSPEVMALGYSYLSVIFLGTFIVFLNSALRTILQAIGDTRTPLVIFGIANALNIILDPVFMFTLNYSIKGAAIATVISNFIGCILILRVVIKKIYKNKLNLFFRSLEFNLKNWLRVLKIGWYSAVSQAARPITGMLMFRIVYSISKSDGTAAFGIGGQLFNYTFIFLVGLSTAISIIVGQSLGKGDVEEARTAIKYGMKFAVYNMIFFSFFYLVIPKVIIGIFINDPNVIQIGANYLRIVFMGLIFVVYSTIYGGVFQGAGDTFPPMMASIISNVVFKLPCAYFLAMFMGINGVWTSVALSVVVESGILIYYYKKDKWITKEI
ncbi:MAG: MATE family efflux transporter [Bacillota bacterium]|nr:MATE family efflux transporter [Bacillota bacterium]